MIDMYLTRHGQTEWNRLWKIQGRMNSPLTEKGIQDALVLKDIISKIELDACFSSPMPRALHTAHLLTGDRGVPLFIEPTLAEMDLGIWEGRYAKDFEIESPDTFDAFRNRADLFVPTKGGESFEQVVSRASLFLEKIKNLPEGTHSVLAVTHCILLQAILMLCDNRPLSSLRSAQKVNQTSLFRIQWNNDNWKVLLRNGESASSANKKRIEQSNNHGRNHEQSQNDRYNF